jgi:hypothetical protein
VGPQVGHPRRGGAVVTSDERLGVAAKDAGPGQG